MSNKKVIKVKARPLKDILEDLTKAMNELQAIDVTGCKIGFFALASVYSPDEKQGGMSYNIGGDPKQLSEGFINYLGSDQGLRFQNMYHFAMMNHTNDVIKRGQMGKKYEVDLTGEKNGDAPVIKEVKEKPAGKKVKM